MNFNDTEIGRLIQKDLSMMEGRRETVKAGMLDRMRIRKVSPKQLHVNPDDEFSYPNIGPNDAIISNYCQLALRNSSLNLEVFDEPIIVNKLRVGGYLILNGHHRWAGAIRAHVKTVRISIENP